MLQKLSVSTIAAILVVMVAPAGAGGLFISDAADTGGKLDIRSYQVTKGDRALYLKECMHRPFFDEDLANGNQLTADLQVTATDGYLVTSTYRAGTLRGWLIPYADGESRPGLALRVKVVRLSPRCVEAVIPRAQVWTQGAVRFDTKLTSFHNGVRDTTLLPAR
jgi:hypothetical protein